MKQYNIYQSQKDKTAELCLGFIKIHILIMFIGIIMKGSVSMKKILCSLVVMLCLLALTSYGADNTAKQVEGGNAFSLVLSGDGTLYGCGSNSLSVLGPDVTVINDGSVWNVVPKPQKIAEGVKAVAANTNIMWKYRPKSVGNIFYMEYETGNHILVLMENGDLYAQGDNYYGQLGQGNNDDYVGLQYVMSNVKKISAGDTFSVCVTENGELYFWGRLEYQGFKTSTCFEETTPHLYGTGFTDVDAGGGHFLALDENGTVWTTGSRAYGAVGDGKDSGITAKLQRVFEGAVAVSAGQTHSLALTASGQVYGWGSNKSYQLGQYIPQEQIHINDSHFTTPVYVMDDAKAIEAGYDNSFVIKTNGDLWGFGTNYDGQLGLGYSDYNGAPIKTATDVKAVSIGKQFAIILKNDGTTYAAGNNYYYNFGAGYKLFNELAWKPALLTASPVFEDGEIGFVDVHEDSYFYSPVLWAVENGITSGTSASTFSPDAICTRGQILTFLWRANGCVTPIELNYFKDVDRNAYYFTALRWAAQVGLCAASESNKYHFYPDNACTRAMVIEFIWKLKGSAQYDTSYLPFVDVNKNSSYAQAVAWALDYGITEGTSENTFSPDAPCTRAQIVTLLQRAFA